MRHVVYEHRRVIPSKILCVGRNYTEHAREMGRFSFLKRQDTAFFFIKPNSAISTQLLAGSNGALEYEAELSFLIHSGRPVAVAVGLDITNRPLQTVCKKRGLPWETAKAFNGSAVFTPFVSIAQEAYLNDLDYQFSLTVDGEVKQAGGVADMLVKPIELMQQAMEHFHLENGDILMCGTPARVGSIYPDSTYRLGLFFREHCIIEHTWVAKSMGGNAAE